jgi:hypothetical protein
MDPVLRIATKSRLVGIWDTSVVFCLDRQLDGKFESFLHQLFVAHWIRPITCHQPTHIEISWSITCLKEKLPQPRLPQNSCPGVRWRSVSGWFPWIVYQTNFSRPDSLSASGIEERRLINLSTATGFDWTPTHLTGVLTRYTTTLAIKLLTL